MRKRAGIGAILAVLATIIMAGAGQSQVTQVEYAWNKGSHFAAGLRYGSTVNASSATADAALTLTMRRNYKFPNAVPLWQEISEFPLSARHLARMRAAVLTAGDYVYIIGGRRGNLQDRCDSSDRYTTATVQYAKLNADGSVGEWKQSEYKYGQPEIDIGIPVHSHKAVAVQDRRGQWRVYVAGGNSTDPEPGYDGGPKAVDVVYSALQNPLSGELGPWEREISLSLPIRLEGLVYAGGALFAFGGCTDTIQAYAQKIVQRADITIRQPGVAQTPNTLRGYYDPLKWDVLPDMLNVPLLETQDYCINNTFICDTSSACPAGSTDSLCRSLAGWTALNAFGAMRSLMYVGAAYKESWDSSMTYSGQSYVGQLDDCNVPKLWKMNAGLKGVAFPGASPIVVDDALVCIGGGITADGSARTVYNNRNRRGLIRDPASPDKMDVMPPKADGAELFYRPLDTGGGANEAFPTSAAFPGAVFWRDWLYVFGYTYGSYPCNKIYRLQMPPVSATDLEEPYMDAGYYLSPIYDLKELAEEKDWPYPVPTSWTLKRVSWKYVKSGGAGDDWAMLRYRVAGEDKDWSYEGCAGGWAPRVPGEGVSPSISGEFEYSSDLPDSSPYYEPIFRKDVRYIQFEVSLYNDEGLGEGSINPVTIPVFREFKILMEPSAASRSSVAPECPMEVYPNPARDSVTVRYSVVPEGGEVKITVYNVAGSRVMEETVRYGGGGFLEHVLETSSLAPGVYVIVAEGSGTLGGGAFSCSEDEIGDIPRRTITGKIMIRR